ncbi:hypothetical protein Mnod_3052 [Methylobacterium nodulans ORS 2060]|uniref:Uncharacterized protein n=1 Tax=Methylobacterium nodulans (strain LMG 21967 / CNCM I-2342 / ORS 2060) TaxID=460265 RepID=B8IIC4_METNO|nr:hypothetical protein Mnod_3052 [Methylobacterium nodulans ORS 2060]
MLRSPHCFALPAARPPARYEPETAAWEIPAVPRARSTIP